MATQIGAGSIIRRGADRLSAKELQTFIDNPEQLEKILEEIDARRDVFLEAEKAAKDKLAEVAKAETSVEEREAALQDSAALLEQQVEVSDQKHRDNMEAQRRRKDEIDIRDKEVTALEARIDEMAMSDAAARSAAGEKLNAREAEINSCEAALEAQDHASVKKALELDKREKHLKTVASMVRQAVNGI